MASVHWNLDPDLVTWVRAQSERLGRSTSQVVGRILRAAKLAESSLDGLSAHVGVYHAQPHLAEQVPVVPLSVPPRELPAWSPEILAAVAAKTGLATSAGRWGITLTGADLGMTALGAVLRNAVMPVTRDQVERAVVLTVLPRLLQPRLDAQVRATWRRLIGSANMALASIAALAIPWTDVLQRAEAQHVLTWEPDGRLSAGTDVNDAPSAELDARAMVSLSWLESVGDLAEDSELVTQLGLRDRWRP